MPADAYWGVHTQRAVTNFPISGQKAHPKLIWALGAIKLAAARANQRLRLLDKKRGRVIERAATEVMQGKWNNQFVVDVFQAGAGTPTNMNANEVIANRALQLLGKKRGNYSVLHPNDHVNMSQSTNDVFPSAMRIASLSLLDALVPELKVFESSLRRKSQQFAKIRKSGRTHLQDAVPIMLGQEFGAYATAIGKHVHRIKALGELRRLNLGGTAIGTGINTHPRYCSIVVKELSKITKLRLQSAKDLIEATQSTTDIAELSEVLKLLAIDLTRICNDIRLLASGPNAGINELFLPAVEPGSSIMPGKVNPSMAEMLNMVCYQVIGNDATIAAASAAGQLELNVMMPVIASNVLESITILTNGIREFTKRCVVGIKANKTACEYYFRHSSALATLLTPKIGYDDAAELVKEALKRKKAVLDIIREKKLMSEKELKQLLKNATKPNL